MPNIIQCPFKSVTIKHGADKDYFGVFESTMKWCKNNLDEQMNIEFVEPTVVTVTFKTKDSHTYLINVLTEYIARHTFIKSVDGVVAKSGIDIEDCVKERAYTMCVNIVENFIRSADFLLNWSLHRFFNNNETLNISLYEKLNLKALRADFDTLLGQPHSISYIFDCLERVMHAKNTGNDEQFFMAALITKSMVENKSIFRLMPETPLHIWVDNGKIMFSCNETTFGIREIMCKELYANGFRPQQDMTSAKVLSLAILFTGVDRVILHKGLEKKGIQEFVQKHSGIYGDIEFEISSELYPASISEVKK